MKIKLSRDDYEKLLAHAQKEFPHEACGLVGGVEYDDYIEVKGVYQLTNLDKSAEHFSMEPKEQFNVVKKIRAKGNKLVANYHSHPYTPARPSEEDKRLAYDESLLYFILSLKDDSPELKAFKIEEQSKVETVEIIIL